MTISQLLHKTCVMNNFSIVPNLILLMSITVLCDIYQLESFVYKLALFVYTMTIVMILYIKYHHNIVNGLLALRYPMYVWYVISIILSTIVYVYCDRASDSITSMSERMFTCIIQLLVVLLSLIMARLPHKWDIEKYVRDMIYLVYNKTLISSQQERCPPPSYETAMAIARGSHIYQAPPPYER